MPTFNYIARDIQGTDHKGTIETVDQSRVARILSKKGLIVISIKEIADKRNRFYNKILNRVSFSDLVVATRQLATMVESGLVLSEAVDILAEQQSNKNFKIALDEVSRDIKSGLDFASALRKHPDIFPPIYPNLVAAGESGGNLDIVLSQLATNLEKDREFRAKITGAMIYPALIIIMMISVMFIMMIFVIPRLTSLYADSTIELPLPTKILIAVSNFFVNFWWLLIIGGVGGAYIFRQWLHTARGKYTFDSLLLKIPVLNKVVIGTNLTYFTRTFGLLTTAGVPLLDSLNIVADVITNAVYKKAIKETYLGVERGLTFSAQLEAVGVFPKIVSQMFRVGEETGKVDKVAFKLADYFESEADHMVKNLTTVIEPLILVVLGVAVAFLVLSIILPIYNLTASFK